VVAAPAALWIATSADALFAGWPRPASAAWPTAHPPTRNATHPGSARRQSGGRRADLLAVAGGVLLGAGLFLSYGLVLMAPLALAVVAAGRRMVRPMLLGLCGTATVVAAFAAAGFWWLSGLHQVYRRMVGRRRIPGPPARLLVFADLAALAIAVGPAVLAAVPPAWHAVTTHWPRLPGPGGGPVPRGSGAGRLLAVPAAVLVAIAVAIGSDLSKGRGGTHLPALGPVAAALCALLPAHQRRGWFAGQLGLALLLAATTELTW